MNVLHEWRDVHLFKKTNKENMIQGVFSSSSSSFIGIVAACFFPSLGHMTSVTFLSHPNIKLFYYTSFKWQRPVNSNTLFGPPDFQMNPHCFLLLVLVCARVFKIWTVRIISSILQINDTSQWTESDLNLPNDSFKPVDFCF